MRLLNRCMLLLLASLFLYGCGGSSSSSDVVDDPSVEEPIVDDDSEGDEDENSEDEEDSTTPEVTGNTAVITPSRSECASPCSIVFSAEDSEFDGMDEHDVFGRELAFHWDFDTDEDRTYGHLYNQTYTYVDSDTAYEVGHAPLVTKTFLCETGTCEYTVRVRAQDAEGNYSDAKQVITVYSEDAYWGAENTICVSNTLDTSADWTGFDKACPSGATKSNEMVYSDMFDGKLVLFKRGDVWSDTDLVTNQSESNYKIGYFGNDEDNRPEIDGYIYIGLGGDDSKNDYSALYTYTSAELIEAVGWPENIYVDGIKTAIVSTPMSFEHIGLHDLDMDREAYDTGGYITVTRGREYCFWNPDKIDCSLVPFAKGLYISSVNIVGSTAAESNSVALNISGIGCDMTNFFGITDTQIRKVGEHNIRLMGFSRLNIMRSKFRGQHYASGKQKLTIRVCASSASSGTLQLGQWQTDEDVDLDVVFSDIGDPTDAANLKVDGGVVDGKVTRAVAEVRPGNGDYVHVSRYQVIHGNQIGDASAPVGNYFGSTKYQTNAVSGDEPLISDVILSANTFENDDGDTSGDFGGGASYAGCLNNSYTDSWSKYCMSPDYEAGDPDDGYAPYELDAINNVLAPTID